ncbi:MAG: T9SS type A sorting domain-containing protein [Bacteroidales bacterium]|nr:MAG: T9SS type A sorting domain-containing protein [Bacteroidales bacterium]
MKKIYSVKFLFTLSLLLLSLFIYGQKHILYVGREVEAATNTSDGDMVDSLLSWGFDVTFMGQDEYNDTDNPYNGIDGAFFGESVGSTSVSRFGPNPDGEDTRQDNFPVNWITLEAGALSGTNSRWALFDEGGGIVVHEGEVPEPSGLDLQMRITDNTHYITDHLNVGDIITFSTATELALIPYVHTLLYDYQVLAEPVITNFNVTPAPDNLMTMGMMEDFNFPRKMFYFGMTNSLIQLQQGTPEFFKLIRKGAEYTYDAIPGPSGIEDKIAEDYGLVAYPNPASETVTIRFKAPVAGNAKVTVFDVTGQQLDIILDVNVQKGYRVIYFDVTNYPEGIYFVKLQADEHSEFIKLLVR